MSFQILPNLKYLIFFYIFKKLIQILTYFCYFCQFTQLFLINYHFYFSQFFSSSTQNPLMIFLDLVRGDEIGHGRFATINCSIDQFPPLMDVKSYGLVCAASLKNEKQVLDSLGDDCPQII